MMSDRVRSILQLLLMVVGVILVIYGHQPTGYVYLSIQLVGLGLILFSLYLYNKKYQ